MYQFVLLLAGTVAFHVKVTYVLCSCAYLRLVLCVLYITNTSNGHGSNSKRDSRRDRDDSKDRGRRDKDRLVRSHIYLDIT
jgi:hypothetical protein